MTLNANQRKIDTRKRETEQGKPCFVLIVAMSLDGRITDGQTEGSEWTSKEDKRFFQRALNRYDALVMGRKTFGIIKRPLTPRHRIVFSRRKTFSHSEECQNVFSGNVAALHALLKRERLTRVAVVGGTSIYDWFLGRGLIDEMYVTLEPIIFGQGKSFTSVLSHPFSGFRLASVKKLNTNGTLLLHYTALSIEKRCNLANTDGRRYLLKNGNV